MLLRRGSASTSTTLWAGSGPGGSTLGVAPLRLRYSRSTRRRSAPRVSPRRAPAGGISGRVSARAGFPSSRLSRPQKLGAGSRSLIVKTGASSEARIAQTRPNHGQRPHCGAIVRLPSRPARRALWEPRCRSGDTERSGGLRGAWHTARMTSGSRWRPSLKRQPERYLREAVETWCQGVAIEESDHAHGRA